MRFKSPAGYFAAGQIILATCLVICTVLAPGYFFSTNQGGISNYGTNNQTVGLFITGFTAAAVGAVAAASRLRAATMQLRQLRNYLFILAILYILVMLSTFSYKQNDDYRQLHEHVSLALFAYMAFMAVRLRLQSGADRHIAAAFGIFLLGLLLGLATLLGPLHTLFTAQVVSAAAFGYMVSRRLKGQH